MRQGRYYPAQQKFLTADDAPQQNQDGQLQGWLGVLNRVGIPTPLPAGYGSINMEYVQGCSTEYLEWEGGAC